MQHMQHLCGKMIDVNYFVSHGEIILDMQDHETGEQLEGDKCPECGEEIFENMLFPLDIFPEVFAEMAEMMEV